MAGTKIDNFSTSDVNLTAIMDTLQGLRQGHFKLSLTNMDSSTAPQIASGSIIDINGSLVYFDADTSISGSPSDGTVYVKLIYSSGVVTAEYSATAPTFDTAKNGWYGTGGNSGHRYIAKMIKSGTSYTGKMLYDSSNIPYTYETQIASGLSGSIASGGTYDITLTYSGNVQAIIDFSMAAPSYNVSISYVTISNNTINIRLVNRLNFSFTIIYSFIVTAVL